jgi:CheY-like chemotaxis protein/DNA-binding XRE family transcriptional regulator
MQYQDVKKGFGLAIKTWRGKSGISQEELAFRAGLHRSYVADIERGARNASLQTIEKLAAALKLSLSTLFQPLSGFPAGADLTTLSSDDLPLDILLVEDDPRDVELTLAAFGAARLANSVQVLRDGAEALDFVFCRGAYSRRKAPHRPQLMLLDLNLPKVQGLEVLRAIKGDQLTRSIHVVVLTISKKDQDTREALQLGAEAYIVKPVDFRRLGEITPQLNCKWTLLVPSPPILPAAHP